MLHAVRGLEHLSYKDRRLLVYLVSLYQSTRTWEALSAAFAVAPLEMQCSDSKTYFSQLRLQPKQQKDLGVLVDSRLDTMLPQELPPQVSYESAHALRSSVTV